MDEELSSAALKYCNDRAEHHAGLGAKINELSQHGVDIVGKIDGRTTLIMKRMVHLVNEY